MCYNSRYSQWELDTVSFKEARLAITSGIQYITSYNIQSTSMTTYQSIYGASEDHFDFQTSRDSNLRLNFNCHTYAYGLPLLFYKSK